MLTTTDGTDLFEKFLIVGTLSEPKIFDFTLVLVLFISYVITPITEPIFNNVFIYSYKYFN